MKNIHVEKRWVVFPSCSFPLPPSCSVALCPHTDSSPPSSRKWERRFGSTWSEGFLHWRKVWPLLLGRKAQENRSCHLKQRVWFHFDFKESGIKALGYSFWSSLPPSCPRPVMLPFSVVQRNNKPQSATLLSAYNLRHITSTKNSPALPTAMRRDCRDAVSSGGTEASSLPGGAPGAAVDRCGGCGGRPGGP